MDNPGDIAQTPPSPPNAATSSGVSSHTLGRSATSVASSALATTQEPVVVVGGEMPFEEEQVPYFREKMYPVKAGQIFGQRFKAVFKVGWTRTWVTWLARDLQLVAALPLNLGQVIAYISADVI